MARVSGDGGGFEIEDYDIAAARLLVMIRL
jgi:hypothetical protein